MYIFNVECGQLEAMQEEWDGLPRGCLNRFTLSTITNLLVLNAGF